ncbi:hypothetical protein HMPREF0971_00990 [Segatella oris F0302]|uniref:Uncharacterized protein n=1 Tax=Segatella oris F0302 TaxID=649760 RepID=D1QPU5_9BACT|nr:hypothetical protein HMPREF0971_00990 [Segatella oris F0302]
MYFLPLFSSSAFHPRMTDSFSASSCFHPWMTDSFSRKSTIYYRI